MQCSRLRWWAVCQTLLDSTSPPAGEQLAIVAKMLEEEEEMRREGERRNATDPPKTWREKFRSNCTCIGWGAAHHAQARAAVRHHNAQGYSSSRLEERRGNNVSRSVFWENEKTWRRKWKRIMIFLQDDKIEKAKEKVLGGSRWAKWCEPNCAKLFSRSGNAP